jgi:septal ring factor EnvC (AmiA/AmiB activator)
MTIKGNKILLLVILTFFVSTSTVVAQKESEKLRKKQKEIQKKIENTKSLLGKKRIDQQITIAELAIINQQIAYRDELIGNYSQQVNRINYQIEESKQDITRQQIELGKLKKRYVDLIRYAYRHRNSYHRLLFVFAASSFNQAYVRVKYLRQFADHRKKQAQRIREKQRELSAKIIELKNAKLEKQELLGKQEVEKENHLNDKTKQQESLSKLKSEESKLKESLTEQEKQKERLAVEIKRAIEEEIRKERERERERQAKANANKKKNNTTPKNNNSASSDKGKKEVHFDVSREGIDLESADFEKNRGRLPWPVEKGEIVSHFGRNPHPTLANVWVNNNGVDIGTSSASTVRSVFNGKVSSVFVIPNAGKCVIISHGAYRTVYANLANVSVSKGQEIKTKQVIGSLLPGENGGLSESHFEIWKVTTNDMEKQNPGLWLYR